MATSGLRLAHVDHGSGFPIADSIVLAVDRCAAGDTGCDDMTIIWIWEGYPRMRWVKFFRAPDAAQRAALAAWCAAEPEPKLQSGSRLVSIR